MGASKRYRGKTCAYCRRPDTSATVDHVVARAFFLPEDRVDLPQVPACVVCNSRKSALENYVSTTLLIGSRHEERGRYLTEMIKPRLAANRRLEREILENSRAELVQVDGVFRPMHPIKVDAAKLKALMEMIVLGLYRYHSNKPLSQDWFPEASMIRRDGEAALWASLSEKFSNPALYVSANLGRGSFTYSAAMSEANPNFTIWNLSWHNGIELHGDAGSEGASYWWAVTRPTDAALQTAVATRNDA